MIEPEIKETTNATPASASAGASAGVGVSARSAARSGSRTRSIVMVALMVAITAVCAWITVPLGPVPFTLQMFAITFAICALTPTQSIAFIFAYVALGAIGLPLFSGMRGGLGVLAGPTGGFLLGYLIGVPLAALFLWALRQLRAKSSRKANAAVEAVDKDAGAYGGTATGKAAKVTGAYGAKAAGAGVVSGAIAGCIFTACAYIVGCIQYVFLTGVPVEVAIAICVLPFIVTDIVKIVLASVCANRVTAALGK